MATVSSISPVNRIIVDGDPTAAGAVPSVVNPGDRIYRSDTGVEYVMTAAGVVAEASLDENPVFTTLTATTFRVGTNPVATTTPAAVIGGATVQLVLAENATDATNKTARFGTAHYTNAEEPLGLVVGSSTSTTGVVQIGGGTSSFNAATAINFYTAANNTTTTGTIVWRITSTGALTGDGQPAAVATTPGTATPTQAITVAQGGNTTIATTGTGGTGGAFTLTTGAGGTAAAAVTAATGGDGGAITLTTGAGTAVAVAGSGTGTGGNSGAVSIVTGVGGAASTSTGANVGGNSGAFSVTTGVGGAATSGSANTGGNSGAITFTTGNAGTGATAAGNSGSISFVTGTTTATVGTILFRPAATTAVTISTTGLTMASTYKIQCAVSTTTRASLNFGNAGTAPTSPADGDAWIESNTLKLRLNGATVTVTTS